MLEEYREKQRLVFKRNPAYFESGKPYLDAVEVYTIPDPSAMLAAVRTGKIDVITTSTGQGLPQQMAAEARAIPGASVVTQAIFQTSENVIGRIDQKPWSDVRVRRAVSLALDREAMLKVLAPEGGALFAGPIPVASRYFVPLDKLGDAARWYRYDVAAAKTLMADAGYGGGFKTKLITTAGYGPEYVSRTELVKDQLSRIGIDASIVVQEYPVWISSTYKGNYDGMVHIPSWTLGDEEEWLATYTPGDTRNQIHLDDPRVTETVRSFRAAADEAARAKLAAQFVRSFHEQLFRVFLPAPAGVTVVNKRVKGYVPSVRGYVTMIVNVSVE
jgi:peptide/nickel transport system substrate-binding protein